MARKTRKVQPDAPEAELDAPVQETAPPAEAGEESSEEVPVPEPDEYRARWQRAQADYKNLRRRTLSDIESAVRHATQPVLTALLSAVDHLDMALSAPCETDDARNMAIGVKMTRDEILKTLETLGVKSIPEGGAFDPDRHQAMATVPSGDLEAGQIAATVRTGYTWGECVLRHTQVHVVAEAAEGDPGADAAAADSTPDVAEDA
jgi:molecular chaperone GrpE